MKKIFLLLSITMSFTLIAQVKVGSNVQNIDPNAVFEIESVTKGVLFPRMTNQEAYSIPSPATGLTIYNTTLKCMSYFDGTTWNCTYVTPQPAPSTAPLGSTFTTFKNGWVSGAYTGTTTTVTHTTGETFNNLTSCQTKMISAGKTSCPASIKGQSGTVYPVALINGQCWMTRNLKEIPSNFSNYTTKSWLATSPNDEGYFGYYNLADLTGASGWGYSEPGANEGIIYQWSAAMNNSRTERIKGICPAGFHIPSDCEWSYLEHGLGLKLADNVLLSAWRGDGPGQGYVGSKMRVTGALWNNASGFTGTPTGKRDITGVFNGRDIPLVWWWSSTETGTNAYTRLIGADYSSILRDADPKSYGFNVRCIQD